MLKIRLTRLGRRKKPFYRIVVANSSAPRDGKFKEVIGTYNPLLLKDNPSRVVLKKDRFDYWIGVGAQLTDRVKILSKMFA